VVLAAALGRDVRRHASVNNNVVFARVLVDFDAADDEEAMAGMELVREAPKLGSHGRQGESLWGDVTERKSKGCIIEREVLAI
jgi:hypothetical protein